MDIKMVMMMVVIVTFTALKIVEQALMDVHRQWKVNLLQISKKKLQKNKQN